jgi:glutathione S-transferase
VKLYYTPTSPYVRKVLVAAHELGVAGRVETALLRPSPVKTDPVLSRENPLSKIPALVLDDGESLYDSPVICEYLETLATTRIVPAAGLERFRVLRRQALADGILDASVLVFYERAHRPEALWWPAWLDGQTEKATQGLDALERDAATFGDTVDLGLIATACTLGWLEFRNVLGDLRPTRPTLFTWYDRFRQRESMKRTEPHG